MHPFPLSARLGLLVLLCCIRAPLAGIVLSGTVLNPDSSARPGVVVSLAGTHLSALTDSAGRWRLTDQIPTGARRLAGTRRQAVSGHLVREGSRLRLSWSGVTPDGRGVGNGFGKGRTPSFAALSPRVADTVLPAVQLPDTLVYSWNGKTILRDTLSPDSPMRSGILRIFDTTLNAAIVHGYVQDAQGHLYRTVRIGAQEWMAQNLALDAKGSYCYGDSAKACATYGRLYLWGDLGIVDSSRQGVCPQGWNVPTDSQWRALEVAAGMDSALAAATGWHGTQGFAFKAASTLWDGDAGTDRYGFHVLPGGYRNYGGGYGGLAADAYFWTATADPYVAVYHLFSHGSEKIGRNTNSLPNGLSVRCIKDAR